MSPLRLKKPFVLTIALAALVAVAALACGGNGKEEPSAAAVDTAAITEAVNQAVAKALASAQQGPPPQQAVAPAPPQIIVQVGTSPGQAQAMPAPSGWATTWSQLMDVNLLKTFDSSGPDLWNAAEHPLVYFASEGPGYGGLTSSSVSLPGYQAIDARTRQVLAAPHFDIGGVAKEDAKFHDVQGAYFEPHGTGVSPDGKYVYVPTAAGADFAGDKTAGRLLVINARTGKLHQIIQVPGRPHHIKSFVDSEGNDRVLAYSWSYGAYILDPKDDNRVVGAVPNGILQGSGYLAFVDHSGRWLFYSVRPPSGVEAQGSVAIIDTKTWARVRSIGVEDPSPIFVAFDANGKFAYVTGGHENLVTKIDISAEDPKDWKMVKFARAGTEGPYGLNLTWQEDLIVTIGKGEGSHNKGITVGLVDPKMLGSARPLGEVYTGCLRADHAILNPDPEANELWISCNSSFETVILDLGNKLKKPGLGIHDYVKARIPSPNGGSSHNGAFVSYNPDWTGRVLADQNGLHGTALQKQKEMLAKKASAR